MVRLRKEGETMRDDEEAGLPPEERQLTTLARKGRP